MNTCDEAVKAKRKIYITLSLFILVYFFSWKATLDTYSFWLSEKIGLDGVAIGIVFAVNGFCAVLIKPVYGFLIDRLGLRKDLLFFISLISITVFPFFFYIYKPLLQNVLYLGIVAGAVFLSMGYYAGCAAAESYLDRFGRLFDLEFGQIRMWGAIGSVFSAASTGYIFNINPMINFGISSAGALVILIIVLTMKIEVSDEVKSRIIAKEKTTLKDITALFRQRNFWTFVLYVCGVVWVLFVAEQQYPRFFITFYDSKETGHQMYGYLGAASLGCEFLCMMVAPGIVNRLGPKAGMLITGFVVAARFIGSGLVTSALAIGIIKLSWGIEMSFLLVSVFKYLEINFDKKINGTMYLLGYQSVNYVGTVLLSPLSGYLYEKIGFADTYLLMGGTALLFTVLSAVLLNNNRKTAQLTLNPRHS
ncbi:TPA: oligosaccharide MFS transporter [Kluyvera ascorbata]|uniref:MFS transporter n=2 Tax=Kluyvera genomosp. 2 TaxID=2774054 RepID=A0A2T2XYZ1_9ENTR|nr:MULTISPECIES: oligosaccharide MFS transporter [unclassified Klebsiella]PSR45523.1 MFS transporter [Kluyvera genomosp. 2]HAT3919692.1 oligosaccharide MFS transporter [Kluyvera ascorbata]BBQ84171.1 MFS transporter [Klebsiella sp. WP3-W18-ESBL-02]BBR21177.1 MFS transporter [Klebsiella sp. WP3-S18-ESBL-05]HAT3944936.1 oligosaccharide MFS transporter [Kluyvera ascorbata]